MFILYEKQSALPDNRNHNVNTIKMYNLNRKQEN